jgi:hypothetical protein
MPSSSFGFETDRDQASKSQEPGTDATASRWTIQVSSTSSVSNSSRPSNVQEPGQARCQVFLAKDNERDESWP